MTNRKNSISVRLVALFTVFSALVMVMSESLYSWCHVSDSYIRDRVVLLEGNGHACTGEQVRAPSGKDYILSAGHCRATVVDGHVTVITENGNTLERAFIAEDPTSDLMLIEGLPNVPGLSVGGHVERFESVRAFTRGERKPTYETDGIVVVKQTVKAPVELDAEHCVGAKYEMIQLDPLEAFLSGTEDTNVCVLSVEETVSTAPITHGSSGGPLFNSQGDVVGVASMASAMFSSWVKLSDIRMFLSGY